MLLDIAILLPKNLRRKLGLETRKAAGKSPRFFIVDNIARIPHLSLWHVKTSKKNISGLVESLKSAVSGIKPIRIACGGLETSEKRVGGIVSIGVKKSNAFSSLQDIVMHATYPFKTGMMPQTFGVWRGKQLKQAKQYGRPAGVPPHITLGWLKDKGEVQRFACAVNIEDMSFISSRIYVCEIDKYWQVRKIINEVKLGR
ncbi:MAG: hypothetical protein NUV53_01785 [Patescibacteria group bacterium]|nr:hypothetical protein [Patescibacteria group bacterium]